MKKAISTALLTAIILSSVSCGGTPSDADVTTGADTGTDSEAPETSVYDLLPKSDLGGTEIKIFGYGAGGYNYVDSEAFEAEQTGEPIDDAIYQRNIDTREPPRSQTRLGSLLFRTRLALDLQSERTLR